MEGFVVRRVVSFGLEFEFDVFPRTHDRGVLVFPSELSGLGWKHQEDPSVLEEIDSPVLVLDCNVGRKFAELVDENWWEIRDGLRRWVEANRRFCPVFACSFVSRSVGGHIHVGIPVRQGFGIFEEYYPYAYVVWRFLPMLYVLTANDPFMDVFEWVSRRQRFSHQCSTSLRWWVGNRPSILSFGRPKTLELRFPDSMFPAVAYANGMLVALLCMSARCVGLMDAYSFSYLKRVLNNFLRRTNEFVERRIRDYVKQYLEQVWGLRIPADVATLLIMLWYGYTPHRVVHGVVSRAVDRERAIVELSKQLMRHRVWTLLTYAKNAISDENFRTMYDFVRRHIDNMRPYITPHRLASLLGIDAQPQTRIIIRRVCWNDEGDRELISRLACRDWQILRRDEARYYMIIREGKLVGYVRTVRKSASNEFIPLEGKMLVDVSEEQRNFIGVQATRLYGRKLGDAVRMILDAMGHA